MNPRSTMAGLLTTAVATITPLAHADTITVCSDGCGHASINAAIEAAEDGDVIQLSAGRYEEGEPIDTLGKGITIRGVLDESGRPRTSLVGLGDGDQVVRADRGSRHPAVLERLAVTNGRLQASRGTTVRDCWFVGDDLGRGVLSAHGECRIEDCTFTGLDDFGLYTTTNRFGGAPVISRCRFVHNQSSNSLVFITQNTVLEDCDFEHNTSCCRALITAMSSTQSPTSPVTISRCRFAFNQAVVIHGYDLPISITECLAIANDADAFIHHRHQPLRMERCHLEDNRWFLATLESNEGNGNFVDCAFLDASPAQGGSQVFHSDVHGDSPAPAFGGCTFNRCRLGDAGESGAFRYVDLGGNRFPEECEPACQADIAGLDGRVDVEDLGLMLAAIGGSDPAADLNHDGWVDGTDLGILMLAWGACD